MHVFSEGGSNKACELAEVFHRETGKRLPISALCLDSTPGAPRYRRLCHAFNKSLPSIPFVRHTGLLIGSIVIGAIWITFSTYRDFETNVISRTRERILDPTYFDLSVPRCYLYSKDDNLIAWQDVYEHAEESYQKGVPVKQVVFQGSKHVGHARKYPDHYWYAIMAIWLDAI